LKITSEVTQTGLSFEKVVEVNSPLTCEENVLAGLDFRSRPLSKDLISAVKVDFKHIKQNFQNNPLASIKDRCYFKVE